MMTSKCLTCSNFKKTNKAPSKKSDKKCASINKKIGKIKISLNTTFGYCSKFEKKIRI